MKLLQTIKNYLEKLEDMEVKSKIVPRDRDHLKAIIDSEISVLGKRCNLNHIDVSNIKDMQGIFANTQFNGNISKWHTSNVENMRGMFENSIFNKDISQWNVAKVKDMSCMFAGSKFNGDISLWNVINVEDMQTMFVDADFTKDISKWKPISLKYVADMFESCACSVPYWEKYETKEERIEAIESFTFTEKLDNKLNKEKLKIKKIKI